MAIVEPESMDELVYFTNRTFDSGKVRLWVPRNDCPKCGKAKMGKPAEDGHVKIRAKEYVCPSCGHSVEKIAYEETLTAYALYTCPKCRYEGEIEAPFKRKNVNGVLTFRFECQKCKEKIDVTKKMKEMKDKKKKKGEDDLPDDDE